MKRVAPLILTHVVLTLFVLALLTPPPDPCQWCGAKRTLRLCERCWTKHCEGCYAWHTTSAPFDPVRSVLDFWLTMGDVAYQALH